MHEYKTFVVMQIMQFWLILTYFCELIVKKDPGGNTLCWHGVFKRWYEYDDEYDAPLCSFICRLIG